MRCGCGLTPTSLPSTSTFKRVGWQAGDAANTLRFACNGLPAPLYTNLFSPGKGVDVADRVAYIHPAGTVLPATLGREMHGLVS
jgi:hypothetical protein